MSLQKHHFDDFNPFARTPATWNDATVRGAPGDDMERVLDRPATFMVGARRTTKDGDWVKSSMPWRTWIEGEPRRGSDLAWGLSRHRESARKDGFCVVLGESIDSARKARAMSTMYAMGLDIDSGSALDDVLDKLEELGLFAVVYTTHSHGRSGLDLSRDAVVKSTGATGEITDATVREYLRPMHDDAFVAAVTVTEERRAAEGVRIICDTPPLDKFRVIFPLLEPVNIIDLADTHDAALRVWADKITGLATEVLGVHFDTSCTDPSRLFYTARHAKDAPWECVIVQGQPVDFDAVPAVPKSDYLAQRKGGGSTGEGARPTTPDGLDLLRWAGEGYARRFEIVEAFEAFAGDRIRRRNGSVAEIECPFDHLHSNPGDPSDSATYVKSADGESSFRFGCHHDGCQGRDNLAFLAECLRLGWFGEDEGFLTGEDAGFLFPLSDEEIAQRADGLAMLQRTPAPADPEVDKGGSLTAPVYTGKLVSDGFVIGKGKKQRANAGRVRDQIRENMRRNYTFVLAEGGDARVILRPARGQAPVFMKKAGLVDGYANQTATYTGKKGGATVIHPAREFFVDPLRRTFAGTQFEPDPDREDPDRFNLWSGFKAAPAEGDWSLLRGHIRDQIVAGNGADEAEDERLFNWLMTWLADLFQHPGRKAGSAIALLGAQGTGKSKIGDWLREAIGAAAVKIASRKHLVGAFNSHLDARILAIAEESFWSGDREAAGALKDLVTAERFMVERKGIDAVERANYLRFIFNSNESWVVPTDDNADARRFFVLRVNDNRKQDGRFFAEIDAQMNAGGLGAMVAELMRWDPAEHGLTWGDLRSPPHTAAKAEQAAFGASGPRARLLAIVETGVLTGRAADGTPYSYDVADDAETLVLREHIAGAMAGTRETHGGTGKMVAEAMRDILGPDAEKGDAKRQIEFQTTPDLDGDERTSRKRGRWVSIPPLREVRARLASVYG